MIICKACNRECNVVTVDFGIGAYEYWGAPGVDVQLAEVSDCCESAYEDTDFPEPPSWLDEPPPEEVDG
jgi:hypothetical protein